jgi:16S rRNA (cytidine1402-2'-O)-methyltransferase
MEDITLRALRILREVSLIAAEDTRTTGRLLQHHSIDTPLVSYHEFSGEGRVAELVERLASGDVALVSDAGTPGLSDPGYRLVQAALEAGVHVSPIPGPSAAIAALVSSGLPTDSFLFLGFLPRQQQARREALATVAQLPHTLIVYASPHRFLALLEDVRAELGDRHVAVGREMTKLYEEIWRGSVGEALDYYGAGEGQVRGEFTLIIAGATAEAAKWDEQEVRRAMSAHLAQGMRRKRAAALVAAQSGWSKRDVYDLSLDK